MSEVDGGAAKAGGQKSKREGLLAFFGTLPGIITAIAALVTAIGGLIVGLRSGDDDPAAPSVKSVESVSPTVPPSTAEASEPPTEEPIEPSAVPTPTPSRKAQVVKLGTPTRVVKLSVKAGDYVQPVVWTISNSARSFSDIIIMSDPASNRMTFLVGSLGKVFFAGTEEVSSNACRSSLAVRKDQSMRVGESDQGTWTCMLVDTTVGATRLDRIDTIGGTATITIILW